MSARQLITEHLDLWTGAVTKKSSSGRGSNGKVELTGVKKLRELILELAVRGKLVSQRVPHQSSSDLIAVMEKEKARLVASKRIKKPKAIGSVSQENHPLNIPENWSWHTLGALGYTQTGSTPAKSKSELFGSDIPFLKPGDISENGEICYYNEGLSEAGKEALGKWAEEDSILMVCIGTIGKCGLIQQPCTFNQQINSITPFVPEASRFLLLCLQSPYFQNAAWEKSSSTTISILNKGKWESIPVPLPPLEEQHRIVQKVDELMALCDRLEQQTSDQLEAHETLVDTLLGTLTQSENTTELADNWTRLAAHFDTLFTTEQSIDKLKQAILQLAVMGRLVEQDAEDEPASDLIQRINQERLKLEGEGKVRAVKKTARAGVVEPLPGKWAKCSLGTCISLISGQHLKGDEYFDDKRPESVPYLTGPAEFGARTPEPQRYTFERRAVAEKGDILITCKGSGVGKLNTASEEIAISRQLMAARPILINARFLYLLLDSLRDAIREKTVGIAIPGISRGDILDANIQLPPLEEQHRIVQKVDELMALCDQLKERLNQASETRCQLAEAVVKEAVA